MNKTYNKNIFSKKPKKGSASIFLYNEQKFVKLIRSAVYLYYNKKIMLQMFKQLKRVSRCKTFIQKIIIEWYKNMQKIRSNNKAIKLSFILYKKWIKKFEPEKEVKKATVKSFVMTQATNIISSKKYYTIKAELKRGWIKNKKYQRIIVNFDILITNYWNYIIQLVKSQISYVRIFIFNEYPENSQFNKRKRSGNSNNKCYTLNSLVPLLNSLVIESGRMSTNAELRERMNSYITAEKMTQAHDELIWKLFDEVLSDPNLVQLKKKYMSIPQSTSLDDLYLMYNVALLDLDNNLVMDERDLWRFWLGLLRLQVDNLQTILLIHRNNSLSEKEFYTAVARASEGMELSPQEKTAILTIEALFKLIDTTFYFFVLADQSMRSTTENMLLLHDVCLPWFKDTKSPSITAQEIQKLSERGIDPTEASDYEKLLMVHDTFHSLVKNVAHAYYSDRRASALWQKKFLNPTELNLVNSKMEPYPKIETQTIYDILRKRKIEIAGRSKERPQTKLQMYAEKRQRISNETLIDNLWEPYKEHIQKYRDLNPIEDFDYYGAFCFLRDEANLFAEVYCNFFGDYTYISLCMAELIFIPLIGFCIKKARRWGK